MSDFGLACCERYESNLRLSYFFNFLRKELHVIGTTSGLHVCCYKKRNIVEVSSKTDHWR